MKLTPASIAACSAAMESVSSTGPHEAPIAHAPKLIEDTRRPVDPSGLKCMTPHSPSRQRRPPHHSALGARQRVIDDKRVRVDGPYDGFDPADLEPRDDAVEDV